MDILPPHFLQKLLSCGLGACNDAEHCETSARSTTVIDVQMQHSGNVGRAVHSRTSKHDVDGPVLLACAADAELLVVSGSLYNPSCLKPTLAPSYDVEMALSLVGALKCRRHQRYARGICMAQGSCHQGIAKH